MKPTRMTEGDMAGVVELLRASYTALGERGGLSPEQTHFLMSERGSHECVRRESKAELYYVVRGGGLIVGMVSVSGHTEGTGVLKGRTWALMEKELAPRVA